MLLFILNGTKKNNQNTSLKSRDIPFYENAENDGFLQSSENQDRKKKVIGVKRYSIWGSLQFVNVWPNKTSHPV